MDAVFALLDDINSGKSAPSKDSALWQNLWVKTVPPACSSGAQAACPRAGSAKLRQERHIYSQSGRSTTSSVRSGMLRRRSSLPAYAAPDGACERLGGLPFL